MSHAVRAHVAVLGNRNVSLGDDDDDSIDGTPAKMNPQLLSPTVCVCSAELYKCNECVAGQHLFECRLIRVDGAKAVVVARQWLVSSLWPHRLLCRTGTRRRWCVAQDDLFHVCIVYETC